MNAKHINWKIIVIILISITVYSVSYYLNSNTIIDERVYANQSYQFYKNNTLPEIYPLLSIVTSIPLAIFGIEKYAFMTVPFISTLLTVFFVYHLSVKQFGCQSRAYVSSILVTCNPLLIWLSGKHMTENLFALILVLTFLLILSKEFTFQNAFIAGTFSSIAYLCRYPGILLFPIITGWLVYRRTNIKVIIAYLIPISFILLYWMFNLFLFNRIFTTETYSFGTLYAKSDIINLNIDMTLIVAMTYKVLAAILLVFGYAIVFLVPQIKYMKLSNPIILFSVVYIIINLGYYVILSSSWSFAWSVDHVARYLLPVFPLLASFFKYPKRFGHLLLPIFFFVGILMGFYLTIYANTHSQVPVSWGDFIADLSS